jgi:hypothetical protein
MMNTSFIRSERMALLLSAVLCRLGHDRERRLRRFAANIALSQNAAN